MRWKLKRRIHDVLLAWVRYDCMSMAASVAFYAALSLFPLLLALMAGVGYFFRFMQRGQNARDEILATVTQQISPEFGTALEKIFSQMQDRALINGPFAGLTFLLAASLVFAQIDRSFQRIWDVKARRKKKGMWVALKAKLFSRVRSLVLLGSTCLLVVLVFLAGLALRLGTEITREWFPEVPTLSGAGTLLLGSAVNILVFFLLYRFLSREAVTWKLCLQAAVTAALLWEGGSRLLSSFSFGSNYSAYGLIGSFLVVQVWIYFNVMVLLIGALVVRVGTRPLNKGS
jgi:membrane protein